MAERTQSHALVSLRLWPAALSMLLLGLVVWFVLASFGQFGIEPGDLVGFSPTDPVETIMVETLTSFPSSTPIPPTQTQSIKPTSTTTPTKIPTPEPTLIPMPEDFAWVGYQEDWFYRYILDWLFADYGFLDDLWEPQGTEHYVEPIRYDPLISKYYSNLWFKWDGEYYDDGDGNLMRLYDVTYYPNGLSGPKGSFADIVASWNKVTPVEWCRFIGRQWYNYPWGIYKELNFTQQEMFESLVWKLTQDSYCPNFDPKSPFYQQPSFDSSGNLIDK